MIRAGAQRPRLQVQATPSPKGDEMIVEYIRYKIEPARTDEFDDAYRRAGELLDASPHCLRWEASRCVEEPEKQIVRIEWDSTEGHLEGFRKSADFKPFLDAIGPFYGDIEEMTHYQVTSNA
jgi:quinol monooxygenase YgiN